MDTELAVAIKDKNITAVVELLNRHADPNASLPKNIGGYGMNKSAIFRACVEAKEDVDLELVKLLISRGAIITADEIAVVIEQFSDPINNKERIHTTLNYIINLWDGTYTRAVGNPLDYIAFALDDEVVTTTILKRLEDLNLITKSMIRLAMAAAIENNNNITLTCLCMYYLSL